MAKKILIAILRLLHIDVISRKIEYPHNMIRENFRVKNYKPKDYDECYKRLSEYYQYHFAAAAGVSIRMPDEMAYSEVRKILEKSQGGYVLNIKNAIKGRHGGMVALVDTIAEEMKKEAMEKYVGYIIGSHVNPLDYNLKVELARQYLEKYARYMLPGEDMMSPYELAANFSAIIKMHVEMVNRYRNLLQ